MSIANNSKDIWSSLRFIEYLMSIMLKLQQVPITGNTKSLSHELTQTRSDCLRLTQCPVIPSYLNSSRMEDSSEFQYYEQVATFHK